MSPPSSRRRFLIRVASVSAALASGGTLSGCKEDDPTLRFDYGVASGDPLADRVILWTHAREEDSDTPVSLTWQVAADAGFASIVSSGTVVAGPDSGHTAKVDATGLTSGTTYYYRFVRGGDRSPVGLTRTLPASASSVKFAVVSCSNYPAGFFNVYAEVAKSDAEFVIHVGDYIYEYGVDGYASAGAAALGRLSKPVTELLTLDDYRTRHAQYKSDPDSKVLHAKLPMIAVWDDHDIADDAWKDGALNHDPATEGAWTARRDASVRAWHEWMPIRTGSDQARIYRSFDFGNLVGLHMLDTRLIGRDRQIDLVQLAERQPAALAEYVSPTRQMLGLEQLQWLQGQLAGSSATWQVLGQQVLMARMELPASILATLDPANTSDAAQAARLQAITDYLAARATPPAQRTPAQVALMDRTLNPRFGFNVDAWDGYVAAREAVLGAAASLGRRLVVLAGDSHNAWHSQLTLKGLANPALAGVKVGEEFATSSVSSPGLEVYLGVLPPAQIKAIFEGIVDDLEWMDPSRRGYLKMTFTALEAKGEWILLDSVTSGTYTASVAHTASMAA